ncbi:MAG: patatin-like phospholipase family protein [Dysgonamonadaceae bacterium]|jgi:NTE family protein|nr:patatin-like phospholipase family protein [Dysgonamonadaceae bacterium]
MYKKIFIALLFIIIAQNTFSQKVGLVLSGGGAKGAVHIGIIKALEENEIPIDYIAGTSIGAVVGSLYAMGYSPEQMLTLIMSDDFHHWQTGQVEEDYQFFFRKPPSDPSFIRFNISLKDSINLKESILPNSIINPIQMNQAFLQLYSQANAQCGGDFDNLFVPFLCMASDIYEKQSIVFREGDLGDAVRASMTFPLFFKPIVKDSIPLWDGGIYDNFPVHPMKKAWNPDFIIGSSVAGFNSKAPAEQSLYDQVENMVMQKTEYYIDPKDGVLMRFKLKDVSLLDFNKAKDLFNLGYNRATEMIDSIKGRTQRRVSPEEIEARRAAYKASLPPLVFRNIYISGTTEAQKTYIESQIIRDDEDNFTFNNFKRTYFRLLANPQIKEINPHAEYDSESQTFDLFMEIKMDNELVVSFGGNVSSMNANQVFLGVGYQNLNEISTNLNLDMQLGNAFSGVTLQGRMEMPYEIPFDVSAIFSYNTRKFYESKKLFIDTDLSTFSNQREAFGKIALGLPFRSKAKVDIMLGYGDLEDRYYQKNHVLSLIGAEFDRSKYHLLNFGVYYQKNSLNSKQYAISGQEHLVYAQYISGKEIFMSADKLHPHRTTRQSYVQLNAHMTNYHPVGSRFKFGYTAEGVFSGKNLWSNYTASVLQAPGFTPTPYSKLVYNEAFHANQYLAGGIIPIFKLNSIFHLRGDFYAFLPLFLIKREENNQAYYGKMFTNPAYSGEVTLVAQFPFMNVSLYLNHYSYPSNNWNFGLNIGYLIFGPKFIQ